MRSFMYFSGYLFLEQLRHTIYIKQDKFTADNIKYTNTQYILHPVSQVLKCSRSTVFDLHVTHSSAAVAVVSPKSEAEVWRAVHAHHHLWDWNKCWSFLSQRQPQTIPALEQTQRKKPCCITWRLMTTCKKDMIKWLNRSIQRRGVCSLLLSSCWMLQIPECVRSQRGSECKTSPLFQWRNCKRYTDTQNTVITERLHIPGHSSLCNNLIHPSSAII